MELDASPENLQDFGDSWHLGDLTMHKNDFLSRCSEAWADDKNRIATAERRLAAADELVANNDRDDWLDLPNGTTMTADTLLWEMFAAQDADA
jgi:hypothetical protein